MLLLWSLSTLDWQAGRLQRALEHAAVAHELGEQTLFPHNRGWVGRVKALIEVDLGLVDEARASAEDGLAFSRGTSNDVFTIMILGALGRLEFVLGNLDAAAGYLNELPAQLLAGSLNDPTQPIWADAIETLIALGELDPARACLERYEAVASRLGRPWAIASAARCRGLISGADGDLAGASTPSTRPSKDWASIFIRSSVAGRCSASASCAGRRSRRRPLVRRWSRRSRSSRSSGAPLWAEKARAELSRISGRHAGVRRS